MIFRITILIVKILKVIKILKQMIIDKSNVNNF